MALAVSTLPTLLKTRGKKPRLTQLSSVEEGFANSFDGTRIWYQSQGHGHPLIFCNGLGCSIFYWKHVVDYFKNTHQVIVFDWRGHGKSELPKDEKNISISALSRDLKAVLDALKIKKVAVVGHSMGTQVIYDFYSKYPNYVKALLPCFGTFGRPMDTFYNFRGARTIFAGIYVFNHLFPKLANSIGHLIAKNPLWFQMGSAMRMLNPALADKKIIREYIDHFTSIDSVFLAKLTLSMQKYDAESLLKKIRVPTLILAASHDKFTPVWISKKMHHLIPKSEMMIIRKATHVALIEQSALINLRIEKFLTERVFGNLQSIKTH